MFTALGMNNVVLIWLSYSEGFCRKKSPKTEGGVGWGGVAGSVEIRAGQKQAGLHRENNTRPHKQEWKWCADRMGISVVGYNNIEKKYWKYKDEFLYMHIYIISSNKHI